MKDLIRCVAFEWFSWVIFMLLVWYPLLWVVCWFIRRPGDEDSKGAAEMVWWISVVLQIGWLMGEVNEHVKHPCKFRDSRPVSEARP